MSGIHPSEALETVAKAVPESCREHIVIIGSLAAGYAFFGNNNSMAVRTKDIDCLLKPFKVAVENGEAISRQLLDTGWQLKKDGDFNRPGNRSTPEHQLPAVRLYPPNVDQADGDAWFIELLTEPASPATHGRQFTRIILDEGHYGLPSFRYLAIVGFHPAKIESLGIHHARPSMMALANLLEHPNIRPDLINGGFAGREVKRSNKDLGRVLALGYLAEKQISGSLRSWAIEWNHVLTSCFPGEANDLAKTAGGGLRELLDQIDDFGEAFHTCTNGLLSAFAIDHQTLREAGNRILGDAIEGLEELILQMNPDS